MWCTSPNMDSVGVIEGKTARIPTAMGKIMNYKYYSPHFHRKKYNMLIKTQIHPELWVFLKEFPEYAQTKQECYTTDK